MAGKAKAAPRGRHGASGEVVAGQRDSQNHIPNTDDRQEALEAFEALCEVRDWLQHSATIMGRLIDREQSVWKDDPGGAPDLTLTMPQAQGLAEGLSTASENLNGTISVLLGLPAERVR